jgi:hypothetical protein
MGNFIGRSGRILAIVNVERSESGGGIHCIVERELGGRKMLFPIVLLVACECAKHILQSSVGPFCLPVGLRVEGC